MRPDWDIYYAMMAQIASLRGSCVRLQVGAVVVSKYNSTLATGYNGASRGAAQCDEIGCLMIDGHCRRSLHAEPNALAHTSYAEALGGTIYIYGASPCYPDALLIISHGLSRVVWVAEENIPYDPLAVEHLQKSGVEVTFLSSVFVRPFLP